MDIPSIPATWSASLAEQLDWWWQNHIRTRLDGLSDDEYFWEPVPGCWSVRPRVKVDPALAWGSGDYVLEHSWPDPVPPPVTTIAWRLGHLSMCFAERNGSHFGAPEVSHRTYDYAPTAGQALAQLDDAYMTWIKGVRGLDDEGLRRPCGPAEGPFAEFPLAELVLHINREALHHSAEITLLRDLYRAKGDDNSGL